MSGGPPHHPHNRQVPASNPAWNHLQASLQVPNFFPRQPQLAHMSNEHSLLHQPSWHTPTTTDAMKIFPQSHMFNEMLKNESLFPKDCVDLSLARNGNQNGELSSTPISLSVRDANKINSMPPSALEIQAVELTRCTNPLMKSASPGLMSVSPSFKSISPGLKSSSPGLLTSAPGLMVGMPPSPGLKSARAHSPGMKIGGRPMSPGLKSISPGLKCDSPGPKQPDCFSALMKPMSPNISTPMLPLLQCPPVETLKAQQKRAHVRVDSILERLNPLQSEKSTVVQEYRPLVHDDGHAQFLPDKEADKPASVIVQPPISVGSCDENSNSNSISNVPVTSSKDEDTVSTNSNEDSSLDSNKSRRKRKPCKTIRVSKDDDGKMTDEKPPTFDGDDFKMEEKLPMLGGTPISGGESVQSPPKAETKQESSTANRRPSQSEKDPVSIVGKMLEEESGKIPERRRSSDDLDDLIPAKTRRKTSSESETIDNIAAMVQDCLKEKKIQETLTVAEKASPTPPPAPMETTSSVDTVDGAKPLSVGVIKGKENVTTTTTRTIEDGFSSTNTTTTTTTMSTNLTSTSSTGAVGGGLGGALGTTIFTPAQKKATNTHFVEVENKLEEMFAGIEDDSDPLKSSAASTAVNALDLDDSKFDDSLSKLEDSVSEEPASAAKTEAVKLKAIEEPQPKKDHSDVKEEEPTKTEDTIAETPTTAPTTTEPSKKKSNQTKKAKRKAPSSRRSSDAAVAASTTFSSTVETTATPSKKKKTSTKKTSSETMSKAKKSKSKSKKGASGGGKGANGGGNVTSSKLDAFKDVYAYDSGSNASSCRSRGPYIHIKGPRDSPLDVNIVNTPSNDDDSDRKVPKTKKYLDDSEYRHKVRSKGLHSSTLSNKYDAQTKDATWICVFCKRGPHASELSGPTSDGEVIPMGDLFGPYYITNECPEFERRLEDPFDKQFKSKKITRCLDESGLLGKPTSAAATSSKRTKKKNSESDSSEPPEVYLGIVETEGGTYEIWAHEDCIVWSPGVYLVGHKIVGLEEAVWTSCNVPCTRCRLKGANVCCLRRGCAQAMHLCCARAASWRFDEDVFKAFCPQHAACNTAAFPKTPGIFSRTTGVFP